MFILDKIEITIDKNKEISDKLYAVNNSVILKIGEDMKASIELITMLIAITPALNNMGLDIDKDILECQIRNVEIALEKKDFMMLADTIRYEVNDSLLILKELIVGGVIKNEQLL